jgi:hypothetical protein
MWPSGITIFDEWAWFKDPNNPIIARQDYYPDGTHSHGGNISRDGYQVLAQMIYSQYSGKISF